MTVLAPDEYEGIVEVNSDTGSEHVVDIVEQRCSCEHYHFGGDEHGRCAHIYRALWATGAREIPRSVIDAAGQNADPHLGRWCPGEVREEGGEIVEADDGGEIIDSDNIIEA
jgi:hypothetical protein